MEETVNSVPNDCKPYSDYGWRCDWKKQKQHLAIWANQDPDETENR